MNRRNFFLSLIQGGLAAYAAFFLKACAYGSNSAAVSPIAGGNCLSNGTSIDIASNHGHSLTVSAADIAAGSAKNYSIQGTADHDHTVSLSAANFTTLSGNTGVQITSSTTGHSHVVTVNCA